MSVLYVKIAAAVVLSFLAFLLLWQRNRVTNELQKTGTWMLDVSWAIFRLVPFLITYIILGYIPQSDVAEFYYPIGLSALDGGIPARDVYTCYSPLFGYWIAPFLAIWRDSRMVVLAMLLVEWLAVRLTYYYYQRQETTGERLFRGVFYYILPMPFIMSVFSGQEDVLLWLFMLLAIPFMPQRPFLAGLVLGLGMLATKAVFILMLIAVGLIMLRNFRQAIWFVAGLATIGLPVAGFMFWKTGTLFLEQQSLEGDWLKAPNLRSLLNPFFAAGLQSAGKIWKWGGLLITIAVALRTVWLIRTRTTTWTYRDYIPFVYIAIYSAMTVVQQNAISNYAYLFMLPLVFTLLNFERTSWCLALIGFNALAAVHPSLWWRIGQPYYNQLSDLLQPLASLEYSIEILLTIGFVYYAVQALRVLRRPSPPTDAHAL
ncbi:hypothetical protein [Spirosoma pomorum]